MEHIQVLVLFEPKLIFKQIILLDSLTLLLIDSYFNKKSELYHEKTLRNQQISSFKGRASIQLGVSIKIYSFLNANTKLYACFWT